jgi:hypothetical protein
MMSSPFSQRGIGRMFYILKVGRIIKRFADTPEDSIG